MGGPKIVTMTSDFGTRDHYVGAMKGVILGIAPTASIVDISHEIPAFNIAEGAFTIAQTYADFPSGSIHLVVVDPGVGSSRRAIVAASAGHLFVAPDNGVLSQVFERVDTWNVREIDSQLGLDQISTTFHGRDLFAPVAARLASGLEFDQIGPPIDDPVRLAPTIPSGGVGRVLHIDRFGNIVTSFVREDVGDSAGLRVGNLIARNWAKPYADAPGAGAFLIVGSSGYVEVSINCGSAAEAAGIAAGTKVRVAGC